MKIPQHNFDFSDVTNLLSPIIGQGVSTLQNANTTVDLVNKDLTFINNYWPELLIGFIIILIATGVLSNAING